MNMRSFDVLGNIAIVKFPEGTKKTEKKKIAEKILKENSGIRTILEKKHKIKGRLRKLSTEFVAGENTKEVLYRENNCVFRFNTDKTYFSPRLSNERKEIASEIKKGENVLVMFAGVAPFSIVIAKNSQAKKVFSNEINREANKYAEMNIKMNKLQDKVELLNGDVKKVVKMIYSHKFVSHPPTPNGKVNICENSCPQKFDVIVMPRPQLKDSFLKEAFSLSKKGTRIYYYDFCKKDEMNFVVEKIKKEAEIAGKKVKILRSKNAGELSPSKIRIRVDFRVL